MADFEYGMVGSAEEPLRGAGFVTLMNWMGAFVSIALIGGLAYWGYQLMVRDVSGVPVVRALEGPMREAPEDPGGLAAEHQGLAVNNIAAEGLAEAPADRLILAPAPTQLTEEDQPAAELAQAVAEVAVVAAPQDAADPIDLAVAEALASTAEAGEVAPLDEATLTAASLDLTGASLAQEGVIAASVSGVVRSIRPLARPAAASTPQISEPVTASDDAGSAIDPASIPVGTRLAQLGAYDSPEVAQAEWAKLAVKFDDYMGDKSLVIQKAQSGGKAFYRLRAMGFTDISDARRFCSALLAGQAACIPVITR